MQVMFITELLRNAERLQFPYVATKSTQDETSSVKSFYIHYSFKTPCGTSGYILFQRFTQYAPKLKFWFEYKVLLKK